MNQRLTMQVMAQVSRRRPDPDARRCQPRTRPQYPRQRGGHSGQVSAIDFINRVNWLFDAWDIDAMVEAFLPDSVTHHTHGVVRGRIETRRFFQEQYPYTVPGSAARHQPDRRSRRRRRDRPLPQPSRPLFTAASPRIVGGQVVATPRSARALGLLGDDGPLAAHRCGWRIFERRVGPTSMNDGLTPGGASNSGCMDW